MTEETKPITCEEFEARVSEYLDGEVFAEDKAGLTRHRNQCNRCDKFLGEMLLTTEALACLREAKTGLESEHEVLSMFLQLYPEPALTEEVDDWTSSKRLWQRFAGHSRDLRITELVESTTLREREDLSAWLAGRAEIALASDRELTERLAQSAVQLLEGSGSNRGKLILALCWGILSAVRAASNLHASRLAWQKAEMLVAEARVDAKVEAQLLAVDALRLSFEGEVAAAEARWKSARKLFHSLNDRRRTLSCSISLAGNHLRSGRIAEGIKVLEELYDALNDEDPARLHLTTLTNLAIAQCEIGAHEKATAIGETLAPLVLQEGGDWPLQLKWLRGTIARAAGKRRVALRYFKEVLDEYKRRGEVGHVIEVHLDILRTEVVDSPFSHLLALVEALADDALVLGAPADYLRSIALLRESIVLDEDLRRVLKGLRQLEKLRNARLLR